MSEPVIVALIIGVGGPAVLFGLNRLFGGWRKDNAETEATIAGEWKDWASELKARVVALEEDVAELKKALEEEREMNHRKSVMMRSLIRWALQLRDEVIRLGGNVPPAPPDVESALTTLDP